MIEQDREGISYGAAFDDELAVHRGLAKSEFGIDEDPSFCVRGYEATAIGSPEWSPTMNFDTFAVVTVNHRRRMS